MNVATLRLEAGGLVPVKTKVDEAATEQIVARTYCHPALGGRPVVRLASDRLGEAEDLAMEFLGFDKPAVSKPLAVQHRRSLSFAAWALINDPDNARYALDLVKRMKAAARKAKSKPGHAWDAYMEFSKELGKSAAHFLPPYWEEVGRTFKDLGNFTYAGRALTRSLEAERVHALESDRARRRDVVLEFVLAGCLAGKALSDYASDLMDQYSPEEAFKIFRDLCVRRTRGGMAPWAAMPKDFAKVAKAADLDGDAELETWLEEVIETPAMGRVSIQFWKTCKKHVQRIVQRNPSFAVALLRHTKPEETYYDDKTLPWIELLKNWGVLEYLWQDEHNGAPPLGEPIAEWFGRVLRFELPVSLTVLEMLEKLQPRLKDEDVPLPLSLKQRYRSDVIDIDVLETCLASGIKVDDPPEEMGVTFDGWLMAEPDHPFRNSDIVHSAKDDRFKTAILSALTEAISCRGGAHSRGWRQEDVLQRPFPEAAGERPGIMKLWHEHFAGVLANLDGCGLASFRIAVGQLQQTFWPESLQHFPDLAEQLNRIDPAEMLMRTLQAGVFAEYGWTDLEAAIKEHKLNIKRDRYGDTNIQLLFPDVLVQDGVKAVAVGPKGVRSWEMKLPKKAEIESLYPVADDLAIEYQDRSSYERFLIWASDPKTKHKAEYRSRYGTTTPTATELDDGSLFIGTRAVRPADKKLPETKDYLHDGERFWRVEREYVGGEDGYQTTVDEIDPQTGKKIRTSVPAFFEKTDGGEIDYDISELFAAPKGLDDSPLGISQRLIGWKTIKRRDASYVGEGIDGRRWDKPLITPQGDAARPIALLPQPGTDEYLPVTTHGGRSGNYWIWDPAGRTVVAVVEDFEDFNEDEPSEQVLVLPIRFWHLMKVRDQGSSKILRKLTEKQSQELLAAAAADLTNRKSSRRKKTQDDGGKATVGRILPVVEKLIPQAPEPLQLGVARTVQLAAEQAAAFTAIRDSATAGKSGQQISATGARDPKVDAAAAHWGFETYYSYSDDEMSLSAHLNAVVEFLKGDVSEADLPPTDFHWFPLLGPISMKAWEAMWLAKSAELGSKDKTAVPWAELLELALSLGLYDLPGEFAEMTGLPEGAKKTTYGYDVDVDSGASFAFRDGDDAYIVIENDGYNSDPYSFLRYSTGKQPGTPPGYKVKGVKKLKPDWSVQQMQAFIQTAKAAEQLPLPTPTELADTAESLNASPGEIGLIWLAGLKMNSYENNFLPSDVRKALGLKVTEVSAAKQSLSNLKDSVREKLFASVLSLGPEAPFAEDRRSVLAAIEKAWKSRMPKRLSIDAALQKRLSAISRQSRWQTIDHEELLSAAADPAKAPALQPRAMEIKPVKTKWSVDLAISADGKHEFDAGILRSAAHLVGLVHAECAAGAAARGEMPALITQIKKLLDDKRTLLTLRDLSIYDYGNGKKIKPVQWVEKYVGKTKSDKNKIARLDEGLIVAAATVDAHEVVVGFRPALLKDAADLARLKGITAVEVAENYGVNGELVPLALLLKSPGVQKLVKDFVSSDLPEGAWPQNPNLTAAKTVAAVAKQHKFSADAAALYLQVLALPDPTTANIRKWNDWKPATIKKATAELIKAKLVLEAKRARAGRNIFLPGEWAELKAPWLPIETWKHKHLCEPEFDVGEQWPAGGPMVFRPYGDLFAAAWQRVVDGDVPKYEEVKGKGRKK